MAEIQKGASVGVKFEHINSWSILQDNATGKAAMFLEKLDGFIEAAAEDWGGINPLQPVMMLGMAARLELELDDIKSIAPDDPLFSMLRYDAFSLIMEVLPKNDGNPMFVEPDSWDIADFRSDCISAAKQTQNQAVIKNLMEGGFTLFQHLDDDFHAEAEALFSLTGYEYASAESKGVKAAAKRALSVFHQVLLQLIPYMDFPIST